ncbi:MAG: MFS transporter [Hyphomicrobiaceae bacterium]|nr:MFS transporter [Hyphomicrobiaceae bacterium]MCC0009846.1 MFS transporter [Hyphomicrobiaceae bacterium]
MLSSHLRIFGALLASLSLLLIGVGLQNTLLGIRAGIERFSTAETGVVMSGYFFGYLAGCWAAPRTIIVAGHIRTFSLFASLTSATAILYAVEPTVWSWLALRFVTGASVAGLYLVVESWLNGATTSEQRGGLLGVYLIINLGSIGVGQQLINIAPADGFILFAVSSVLVSLAVVPVALTRTSAPAPPATPALNLARLYRVSPVALVGTLVSGVTSGVFWGMAPTYGLLNGLDTFRIGNFMTIVVLGGMILQWPLGRLSDRMDRRIVLIGIAGALTLVSITMALIDPIAARSLFLLLSFVYGGCLLTLYAICNAHANDAAPPAAAMEVASGLLIVFALGAMSGPLVVSWAMTSFGANAYFELTATAAFLLVVFAVARVVVKAPVPSEKTGDFEPVPAGLAPPPMSSEFDSPASQITGVECH